MKYILCYGDSNTWGYIPGSGGRYDYNVRWTGIVGQLLGSEYHIYENALNGRTTVFEDPIEEGRNGKMNFDTTLISNAPLDLVVLMLGVNDTKIRFHQETWDIGWGIDLLLSYIEKSAAGRDGRTPEILLISPVLLNEEWGKSLHGTVFDSTSVEKMKKMADVFEIIAKRHSCHFMNAAMYAKASGDGVHMNEEAHKQLGIAIAKKIQTIL